MKLTILAILFFVFTAANATTYYVSNAGSNSNNGTSTATSWQTIAKVNGFIFSSGDSVLFKCGDVWNEALIVPASNIKFASYGTGNQPTITGFQTVTGFTNVYGNVWQASTGVLHRMITAVTINGLFAWKARYPNNSFLDYKQAFDTSMKTYFTGDTSYVGAELVIRSKQWVLDLSKITSQHNDTLGFQPTTTYPLFGNWGFFFQNQQRFIDSVGEYSFDSSTGILSVYSVGTPTVQMSSIDTLVLLSHKDNVSITNINLTGANIHTIILDTSHNFTLKRSTINNAGNYGIYGSKCRDTWIDSSLIQNCNNDAIVLGSAFPGVAGITLDTCKRTRITNDTFRLIGTKAGMANAKIYKTIPDGENNYQCILISSDSSYIANNRIDSVGYAVIHWLGYRDTMMHNYITNWCFIKSDGGAFYSYLGSTLASNRDSVTFIYRNILINTNGGIAGPGHGMFQDAVAPSAGLYADNFTSGVTHKENTIIDCNFAGIYSLEASNNTYIGNTVIDSSQGTPYLVYVAGSNLKLRNNIFYQKSFDGYYYYSMRVEQTLAGYSSDSNYFYQPAYGSRPNLWYNGVPYNLSQFQTNFGFDLHSTDVIPARAISSTPLVLYNPTNKDSTIFLAPSYVDARGNNLLGNKIVLQPYTSCVLFSTNPFLGTKYYYLIH